MDYLSHIHLLHIGFDSHLPITNVPVPDEAFLTDINPLHADRDNLLPHKIAHVLSDAPILLLLHAGRNNPLLLNLFNAKNPYNPHVNLHDLPNHILTHKNLHP